MHRIPRPDEIPEFSKASADVNLAMPPTSSNSAARWRRFRVNERDAYKNTVECLLKNQNRLCAYCECDIIGQNREVEHIIPKKTSGVADYTLMWSNLCVCCDGRISEIKGLPDQMKKNKRDLMTCGARKSGIDPRGKCMNPYDMPERIICALSKTVVNEFEEPISEFVTDDEVCRDEKISPELAKSTLNVLGLNSRVLARRRAQALRQFDEEIKLLRKTHGPKRQKIIDELRAFCKNDRMPFITTIRLYLRDYVE